VIEITKTPPSIYLIQKYWKNRPEFERAFRWEEGRPYCFACTAPNRLTKIERAHIIARVDGGYAWPGNFVLLCKDCHREAPMITDRTLFIEWVQNHPTFLETLARLTTDAMKDYPDFRFSLTDGIAATRLMHLRNFKFHPHSSFREKVEAMTFMFKEYMKLRDNVFG
jgi:hypothetical protein